MSLWTSSLPSLFMVLVLTIVVMQSGCNAATAAAKQRPPRPASPKINSVKEMRITVAQITHRLQKVEKSLAPLKTSQTDLDRKFNSYSARTAHHEWQTANQQQAIANRIRQDAKQLKFQVREIGQAVRSQFGPRIDMLQSPSLRRFARDAPTQTQLAQSAKIYKRILELLQNMIECPVHILQFLGEDASESEDDDMPFENSEPVYGEEPDAVYGYQYYN
ncbi:uncharacterized protein LOC135700635 isoform X1 [Ochlerotatus camptorhynchus]|uniref:uncharacterized protein LOC135700635 isoform X1 n=1 Tax=Ochlerotatus camptorhynchus TaxID=644619 RepID=UPI0031E1CA42